MRRSGLKAMLLFHSSAGARLSIRAALPLLATLVVAVAMQEFPQAVIARIARGLATANGDTTVRIVAAGLCLMAASWSAPRICQGIGGWLRHLPVDGVTHRRAALGAVVVAQAPLLITWAALAGVAVAAGDPVSSARLAGLPLVALGAAWASLPARPGLVTGALGAAAMLCGLSSSWWIAAAGCACLVAAEIVAGDLLPAAAPRTRRRLPARLTWMRLCARAVGLKAIGPLVYALLPMAACAMFLRNNELTAITAARGARLGGIVALTLGVGGIAELLAVHRPPWPWGRSLPWTASHRITRDAIFLGLHSAALLLIMLPLSLSGALAGAMVLPALCLRAAGLMRHIGEARTGAAGRLMAEGSVAAGLACLVWWVPLILLAMTPLLLRHAIAQEKRQKVTRWDELHHLSAGDSMSWSA